MARRSIADQTLQLARARSGADVVVGTITGKVHLGRLETELGCWFMVDHKSRRVGNVLIEDGPKTVYAATSQARLDAVLKAHEV